MLQTLKRARACVYTCVSVYLCECVHICVSVCIFVCARKQVIDQQSVEALLAVMSEKKKRVDGIPPAICIGLIDTYLQRHVRCCRGSLHICGDVMMGSCVVWCVVCV